MRDVQTKREFTEQFRQELREEWKPKVRALVQGMMEEHHVSWFDACVMAERALLLAAMNIRQRPTNPLAAYDESDQDLVMHVMLAVCCELREEC